MYKYIKNTGTCLSFCLLVSISYAAYSKQKSESWLDTQINKDPEIIEVGPVMQSCIHYMVNH